MALKDTAQIKPRAGALLISEPFLPDDNFKRSVVLLCEHNDEGTIGFILNRPLGVTVTEAVEDFPSFPSSLYLGGPVENNTLHYLHRLGEEIPGSVEVLDGLFWGGNFEILKAKLGQGVIKEEDIRFFLGYSGWSPGQLDDELKEKSWIVSQAKSQYVFETETDLLWKTILQEMGGQYFIMSNFPDNPQLN